MAEEHGVLERPGVALHYWLSGPAEAPLVVLSHGANADHRMFDGQVPVLAERYRVLTWDAPGQGLSQPLPADFSCRRVAADLIALLDHLRVASAVLVGQSMGGNVSQEVAFLHPGRARALVLIDCTDNTQKLTGAERFALRSAGPIFAAYPFGLLKRQSVEQSAVTAEARRRLAEEFEMVAGKREFVRVVMASTDCLHHEPGYRVPVPMLLILGVYDKLGNIALAMPRMAARNEARLVEVCDAGHVANMDAPEVVNAELLRFLDGPAFADR